MVIVPSKYFIPYFKDDSVLIQIKEDFLLNKVFRPCCNIKFSMYNNIAFQRRLRSKFVSWSFFLKINPFEGKTRKAKTFCRLYETEWEKERTLIVVGAKSLHSKWNSAIIETGTPEFVGKHENLPLAFWWKGKIFDVSFVETCITYVGIAELIIHSVVLNWSPWVEIQHNFALLGGLKHSRDQSRFELETSQHELEFKRPRLVNKTQSVFYATISWVQLQLYYSLHAVTPASSDLPDSSVIRNTNKLEH